METLTALHTRRSIRNYTDQAVPEQAILTLLEAAMIAPSAGNAQPWQYIIVDDPTVLRQVPVINPYAGMAPNAPVSIVVCGDLNAEKYKGFWVQDCSAAIQNMLLAATALGLGTVWTGIYPVEERVLAFQRLLQLPESIIPLALIVIGHPAASSERKSRFDATKVHHNCWGKPRSFGTCRA
ncbi:MAG: nitroreductase family protein [Desulfovibrio sp.]|jgi:nitroreductase|nr:nitroreductase family protein [Desulfovibrio sp.]